MTNERRHAFSIVCIGFALFVSEGFLVISMNDLTKVKKQIDSLQAENKALKDISDGQEIHQRFIDSDHQKLTEDVVRLRDDLDELKFKEDGWQELSHPRRNR